VRGIEGGDAQLVVADGQVHQLRRRDPPEGFPQRLVDVDVGGAVADLAPVEGGRQEIQPHPDGVARRERLEPQAVTVGGADRVPHADRGRLEVPGLGHVGQHEQTAGQHERLGSESREERGHLGETPGREGRSQFQGQAGVIENRCRGERSHDGTVPGNTGKYWGNVKQVEGADVVRAPSARPAVVAFVPPRMPGKVLVSHVFDMRVAHVKHMAGLCGDPHRR